MNSKAASGTLEATEAGRAMDAPITRVTVYTDRALVTREAEVKLDAGRNILVVEKLPVNVTESSLKARADAEDAVVEGVSSEVVVHREAPKGNVAELEKELLAVNDKVSLNGHLQEAVNFRDECYEKYFQYANKALSEESTKPDVDTGAWKKVVEFVRNGKLEAARRGKDLEIESEKLSREYEILSNRLDQIRNPASTVTRTARIVIEADSPATAKVSLTYIISGATWVPQYDVRLTLEGGLELEYYGAIQQQTGEDWTDVNLTLSTAKPHLGASRPRLETLQLSGYKIEKRKEIQLESDFKEAKKLDKDAREGVPAPEPSAEPSGYVPSAIDDKGTSVVFHIAKPAEIPSDGSYHRVLVTEMALDARVLYETVPSERPFAYLIAETANASEYPLIGGAVNIFKASGYVGTSALKYTAPGEKMKVSLGADDQVKVRRVIDKKKVEEPRFFKSRKTVTYAFDITVENLRAGAETVRVIDRVAVSQVKEVEARLLDSTTEPSEKKDDGILVWLCKMEPGEKRTIHLEYEITAPERFILPVG